MIRSRATVKLAAAAAILTFAPLAAAAAELDSRGVLEIVEADECVAEAYDVSAVVKMRDLLVFGVDEGSAIQILEKDDGTYVPRHRIELGERETDIEGLARNGDRLYVIGSHSSKRGTVKSDKKRKKNRERLARVEAEPSRDRLFRLRLDANGELDGEVEQITLREILENDPYLGPFAGTRGDASANPPIPAVPGIPSKDNGIDIEGLAVDGDTLSVGFRGPVLRGGYAPVMTFEFDSPQSYEMRFVTLGGRGIRSLAHVDDGFLIVAGPVGDSDLSYRLYFWDGEDCVGGKNVADPPCVAVDLGTIPTWADAKAEGLEVLAESDAGYEVLIVYDSAPLGLPTRFHAPKP